LLATCGLKAAKGDGSDLSSLLAGKSALTREALYWHYPHYSNQLSWPGGAIRLGPWKLVESYETGRLELFDLFRDPRESNNLADKFPDQVHTLAGELALWRLAVDAQMPTPNPGYMPNPQAEDGSITIPAATAEVHGVMLRFEPLPHKNTLGYWVRFNDWASFEFEVKHPGEFAVEALVGCGAGSGGSVVEFRIGEKALKLTVPVTGGFQNFQRQSLGRVAIEKAGRHRLEVRALSKPGAAVMDLREVKLVPVAKGGE
jgi:arylsulfatase A